MKNFNSQYLDIVQQVLSEGEYTTGRNSNILQYFAPIPLVVKNVYKDFPILSVRKVPFYKAALETFFFLGGESSYESMPEVLRNSWWKPWAAQAKANNSWGRFYSAQWRHSYTDNTITDNTDFDQLEHLIQNLCAVVRTGQVNRRMVVSLWRTQDFISGYTIDPAVLPSCHSTSLIFNLVPKWHKEECTYQEYYLDLQHTQRSLDLMTGTASDLIYSGLLMQYLCNEVTNRLYNVAQPENIPFIYPRKLVFAPANTHIYEKHIEQAKELLMLNIDAVYEPVRLYLKGPIVDFTRFKTIEDVKEVANIRGYKPVEGQYNFELIG